MVQSDKVGFVDFNLCKGEKQVRGTRFFQNLRFLGELEIAVLEKIWGRENIAVRDVFKELQQERDIAYTTVMTTMDRLWRKGLLSRVKDRNAYLYSPVYSKKNLIQKCINQVLDSILPDITEPSLAHFVSNLEKVNPALLSELKELLSERAKETKR